MANTLGITEVLLANLADISHAVNTVSDPAVRDRWNTSATVRVTDHPADDAGETGSDTSKMALFTNKALHNTWRLGGAKIGTATVTTAVDGIDIVAPQ